MRVLSTWLIVTGALFTATTFVHAKANRGGATVAVFPIRAAGVAPDHLEILTDAVTTASDSLFSMLVLGPTDAQELLPPAQRGKLGKCDNVICMARLGAAVNATYVLHIKAISANDNILLSIKWVDVRRERITARHQMSIRDDVLTYLASVREALAPIQARLATGSDTHTAAEETTVPTSESVSPASPPANDAPSSAVSSSETVPTTTEVASVEEPEPTVQEPTVQEPPASGWAGFGYGHVNAAVALDAGMTDAHGVVVNKVESGGPADVAGVKVGDVIVACNGVAMNAPADLAALLKKKLAGQTLALSILRDGGEWAIDMTLDEKPGTDVESSAVARAAQKPSVPEPRTETTTSPDASVTGRATTPETSESLAATRRITTETSQSSGTSGSYSQETATAVTEPMDSVWIGTYQGGAGLIIVSNDIMGIKSGFTRFEINADAGVRFLDPSGDFPQGDGGTRNAFSFSLNAGGGFKYAKYTFESSMGSSLPISGFNDPISGGALVLSATPAYTYLSFNPLDSETMAQGGWGLTIGLRVGIELGKIPPDVPEFNISGTSAGSGEEPESDSFGFLITPVVGVEFPKFNPGTASFSSFTITGSLWPWPLMASIALGGTFEFGGSGGGSTNW